MGSTFKVPIIDMNENEGLSKKIVKACEEWGCFRLLNHGIPSDLMAEMKIVARSLLDLPVENKQQVTSPGAGQGYTPPNQASPFFEGLSVNDLTSHGAVDDFCHRLNASPHQRETITKYSKALRNLAENIEKKLAEGMGLKSSEDLFKEWTCQFRMNKYNYSPQTIGQTGALIHSDPGFLTLLQDDEIVGGLEVVTNSSGELVPLPPMPGSLVINVGDVAKAWSNGRFCNVKHRVQCYEAATRVSVVLFVLAPKQSKVEAPAEFVDSEHPRLYVPLDFDEYRNLRASTRSPTGEALELFSATSSLKSP